MCLIRERERERSIETFGNDINVFLEPMIDKLVDLFEKGVGDVWDEYKKEHVTIKAVLITTITDLPGRGYLSEEKTKGYTGCVECLDDTDAVICQITQR